ncbi:MAG: hypothetical protein IIT48_03955 [Lachnospiraceae bacterium]|nr:hypothetical protein [Eubacterium sp.]MBQ5445803.1 hypothetical protein [Lachnospiraceae bacterium]
MGDIKFSKEDYDNKMNYLGYMRTYTNDTRILIKEPEVSSSETLKEMLDLYRKLWGLVGTYSETLADTLTSLKNAGEYIFETDKDISNGIEYLK